jgi:hypothetical protein
MGAPPTLIFNEKGKVMRKIFIMIMCLSLLTIGGTAFADYHSFSTYHMKDPSQMYLAAFNDIGYGYQSSVVGAMYLFNSFREQDGKEPLNGRELLDAMFKESRCRMEDGEQVCDYSWRKNLFKGKEEELSRADVSPKDMQITDYEALKYYEMFH